MRFEGVCRFCGQIQTVEAADQHQADNIATYQCTCPDGSRARRIYKLEENIDAICGQGAEEYGLEPVDKDVQMVLNEIGGLAMADRLQSASININDTVVKIIVNTKGAVKVTRRATKALQTEI